MSGQFGDGQAELTAGQRARVLADVERRREANRARIAELGIDLSPEGIAAEGREIERDRQARRAERAGQLDLGGV